MSATVNPEPLVGRFRTVRLPSDERLARRAADGDEGAFAAIYNRYHQDLYRFCLAIVRDSQDAQDALQNTMVKVLRALPGETRGIQLKPWLYRIAHNEAVELLRRRRPDAELDPELSAVGGALSDTAATRERLRRLLDDLGELPERQRAVLVMRELAGLGFEEIGAALDTSGAVARQAAYEARLSLRQMEAGREMTCKESMWELSEADGRVVRRRDIQAHLRACPQCRAFGEEIARRRHDLAAIAPLPLAASAGLLQGLLGSGGASVATGAGSAGTGAGGALVGATAAGAGKTVATSAVLKAAATVAVAAAGVTAADRGGLIETPLPAGIGGAKSSGPVPGETAPQRSAQQQTDSAVPTPSNGAQETSAIDRSEPDDRSKGGSAQSENGPPAETDTLGPTRGQEKGKAGDPPAAGGHGQQTAAPPSGGEAKGAKGSDHNPGASERHDAGPASKGKPSHGSSAGSKAPSAKPQGAPPTEVGPDKAAGAPFQPSKSEVSKGASSSTESANPSKEAR